MRPIQISKSGRFANSQKKRIMNAFQKIACSFAYDIVNIMNKELAKKLLVGGKF